MLLRNDHAEICLRLIEVPEPRAAVAPFPVDFLSVVEHGAQLVHRTVEKGLFFRGQGRRRVGQKLRPVGIAVNRSASHHTSPRLERSRSVSDMVGQYASCPGENRLLVRKSRRKEAELMEGPPDRGKPLGESVGRTRNDKVLSEYLALKFKKMRRGGTSTTAGYRNSSGRRFATFFPSPRALDFFPSPRQRVPERSEGGEGEPQALSHRADCQLTHCLWLPLTRHGLRPCHPLHHALAFAALGERERKETVPLLRRLPLNHRHEATGLPPPQRGIVPVVAQ